MAKTSTALPQDNFVLLDGLRGLGAVIVLIGHTIQYWGGYWAPSGAVIVDLFFLLSGFVIAYAYEPRFAAGMRAAEFMTHRVVRLYPLYLLGTMLGFVGLCAMTIGDIDGSERAMSYTAQLVPQLFMMPAPEFLGDHQMYSMNVPAWTLFFELFVNLVYILAFRWLRHTRILVMVVIGCALALVFTVFHFGYIDAGADWAQWWAGFARAGFGFFAGVLTFRLLGRPTTGRRPESNWAFVLLIAIPIACFIPATPQLRPFVDLTLAAVLGIPGLRIAQGIAPPARYHGLFIVGGRISYAIYILHQPFREVAERISWRTPVLYEVQPLGGVAILVMVVALSYFAEKYYDRPLRRMIVGMLKQREMRRRGPGRAASPG